MNADQVEPKGDEVASEENSRYYGSYYYNCCFGVPYERSDIWLKQFRWVAERIAVDVAPRSVLDAGCAIGLLVETLRERGIDAEGFDISEYAVGQAHESIREKVRVGSILEPFGRRYDLIVTIEVLEHLKPHEAERAVANLCDHADDVLFSSTPFDFKEASHFNVQPPEYWAEMFARHGFYRDLDYDASFMAKWAVRFRKGDLPAHRVAAQYERKLWRLLQENLGARESLMEHQDALVRAEAERAGAVARKEILEVAARDYEAGMAERVAFEDALAKEFRESVTAWSDHVQVLGQHIQRATNDHRLLIELIAERDARLVESEHRCVELAGSAQSACEGEQEAIRALAQVQAQLAEAMASGTWKLANRIGRMRRLMGRRSGRIDSGHESSGPRKER